MYYFFNSNKELVETISDNIVAGSISSNTIYAYWDSTTFTGGSIVSCSIKFKQIGGDELATEYEGTLEDNIQIPENEDRDYQYFQEYTNYKMAKFSIPDEVLSQNGSWIAIIRLATTNGATIYAMGDATFMVQGSYIYDSSITQSQYNYLINLNDWNLSIKDYIYKDPQEEGTIDVNAKLYVVGDIETEGTLTADTLVVNGGGNFSTLKVTNYLTDGITTRTMAWVLAKKTTLYRHSIDCLNTEGDYCDMVIVSTDSTAIRSLQELNDMLESTFIVSKFYDTDAMKPISYKEYNGSNDTLEIWFISSSIESETMASLGSDTVTQL